MKSLDFTYNSKPLKKLALFWAIQFPFNCEIYTIVQLSSLKLSMDLQWIQASSLKSISIPNVPQVLHIYTARKSATLTKMSECFVGQYEYGYFFYKYRNNCSRMTVSCWSIEVKKWNNIPSRTGLSNYYS